METKDGQKIIFSNSYGYNKGFENIKKIVFIHLKRTYLI